MNDLFNEKIECLKLIKVELNQKNRLVFKFEPHFVRRISFSTGSKVELISIHFKQIPNLKQTNLKSIGQSVHLLTNGMQTRRNIFEFWQQVYRLRLPINYNEETGNGDNIHFCMFENGEIYPFCYLMRDFERKNEKSEQLLLKLLRDLKRHVEKTEIFESNNLMFINSESDLEDCLLVSDDGLSSLAKNPSALNNKYDISTKNGVFNDDHLKLNDQSSIKPVKFYNKRPLDNINDASDSTDNDVILMHNDLSDENNNIIQKPERYVFLLKLFILFNHFVLIFST
jgi:hypothetical protein